MAAKAAQQPTSGTSFSALAILCFLLVPPFNGAEAVLCERKSLTWQGICDDSIRCSVQCREWEVAVDGACRVVALRSSCMCYFELTLSSCLGAGRSADRDGLVTDPGLESALRGRGAPFLL